MSASRGNPVHYRAQNYRRLMLGKCRETTEKWQRTVLKNWLNEENILFLCLVRVSKTGRILGENRRPEIFAENGRFPAKTAGLGTLLRIWFLFLWKFCLKNAGQHKKHNLQNNAGRIVSKKVNSSLVFTCKRGLHGTKTRWQRTLRLKSEFTASYPGQFALSELPEEAWRVFPTSLTGHITSEIAEDDWERGW